VVISKEAYHKMVDSIKSIPPEEGGILGSVSGVIKFIELDKGVNSPKACSYSPDVSHLNSIISKWEKANISFQGIFHSHFFGIDTLSKGDIRYIETIMKSMPKTIDNLLFPIVVMPEKKLVVYCAYKIDGSIKIKRDRLIIC